MVVSVISNKIQMHSDNFKHSFHIPLHAMLINRLKLVHAPCMCAEQQCIIISNCTTCFNILEMIETAGGRRYTCIVHAYIVYTVNFQYANTCKSH